VVLREFSVDDYFRARISMMRTGNRTPLFADTVGRCFKYGAIGMTFASSLLELDPEIPSTPINRRTRRNIGEIVNKISAQSFRAKITDRVFISHLPVRPHAVM
jgi:hypothetical protein